MSQPRKAMKDLGFQGCCLRCDAEDVGGLSRCKSCIGYHKLVKTLLIDDYDSILIQHMKDLYSMLSNPEMFDNDDIHGAELIYQQSLVSDADFDGGYIYPDDIADLFNKESPVNRRIMQDLVNKNPWKHTDLTIDAVKGIGGMFSLDNGTGQRFLTKSEICLVVDNDKKN